MICIQLGEVVGYVLDGGGGGRGGNKNGIWRRGGVMHFCGGGRGEAGGFCWMLSEECGIHG